MVRPRVAYLSVAGNGVSHLVSVSFSELCSFSWRMLLLLPDYKIHLQLSQVVVGIFTTEISMMRWFGNCGTAIVCSLSESGLVMLLTVDTSVWTVFELTNVDQTDNRRYPSHFFLIIHEIYLILEILRKSIFFQKYYPIGVAEADSSLSSLVKPSRDLPSLVAYQWRVLEYQWRVLWVHATSN